MFRQTPRWFSCFSLSERQRDRTGETVISLCSLLVVTSCFFTAGPLRAQVLGHRPSPETQPQPDTLVLASGDVIDVKVFDTPELSATKVRVSPAGYVDLPVIGKVLVAGLTPLQADEAVHDQFRDSKIMQDARVTIQVTDYATQGVSVLGEVNKPGTYVLLGRQTLFEALSAAGGVTGREGGTITITHASDAMHPVTVPFDSAAFSANGQQPALQPGDLVFVPKARSIFVIGDVGRPGEFPMPNDAPLNVLKAVALAQGANHNASLRKASIVRETPSGVETVPIDLTKIAESRSVDPTLEPGDVVVIPHSGVKAFLEYGLPSIAGGAVGGATAALAVR